MAAAVGVLLISSAAPAATALVVSADADARVVRVRPNTNFGSAPRLVSDASPRTESFLRFRVTRVRASERVAKARLRLYAADASSNGPAIYTTAATWSEKRITWRNRPPRTSRRLANTGSVRGRSWVEFDVTSAVRGNGTYSFVLAPTSGDLSTHSREARTLRPQLVLTTKKGTPLPASSDPVLAGAGDIATGGSANYDEATAKVLDSINPTRVFTAGDSAYPDGSLSEFNAHYRPTWGRHKAKTRPSPGNHDYHTSGASGYFAYFGAAAGSPSRPYYAYKLGSWRIYSLNSEIDSGSTSRQVTWLKNDLAANARGKCVLAYWHQPLKSAGPHGDESDVQPLFSALYNAGADVVVNGHDHNYQRWAPLNASGRVDQARGIRQFVVGTGGAGLYRLTSHPSALLAYSDKVYGVLKLVLHASSYDFEFVPIAGQKYTDSGSGPCHGERIAPSPGRPSSTYPVRGIIDRDSSATGFEDLAALGFNYIDSGPYKDQLDPLAARGLKGFIWLGGYSESRCAFRKSNAWIRSHVSAIAGHPAIGGYYIDDEPDDAVNCPNVVAQIKARNQLVKSLDPGPPTFLVLYKVDWFQRFVGATDIMVADAYPCSRKNGCDYSVIDRAIAELNRLDVRYWAMIQAFGDDWHRVPTPEELHQQFLRWRASRMKGYFVFAWHWPANDSTLWLANHPELQAQLAEENAR